MTLEDQSLKYSEENRNMDLRQNLENPPWIVDNSGESDDDEWLFNSMQRYKQLCTYSIVCEATSIDIHPISRQLVIAGLRQPMIANKLNNQTTFEIAVYRIPEKLVVENNEEKEGLLNGRDLSLLAGIGLEKEILNVRFLSSEQLIVIQSKALSVWSIISDSDLLIELKHFPLEIELYTTNILVINQHSVLLSSSQIDQIQIHELDLSLHPNNPELNFTNLKDIKLDNCPKNLKFEKFELFSKDLISVLTTNQSKDRSFIFLEPQIAKGESLNLEYLGGVEDADEEVKSKFELLESSWTKTSNDKEILGAAIKAEQLSEGKRRLCCVIYFVRNLGKKILKSNKCLQKLKFNREDLIFKKEISGKPPYVSMQFLPTSSTFSTIDASYESTMSHQRTLVIKLENTIKLYQLNFHRVSDYESNHSWKVDCNLLFCHDAHKSQILHVMQYSTRLPQLFISVDESKELHAWNWQSNESN